MAFRKYGDSSRLGQATVEIPEPAVGADKTASPIPEAVDGFSAEELLKFDRSGARPATGPATPQADKSSK